MLGKSVDIGKSAAVGASVRHILQRIERDETLAAAEHLLICEPKHELAIVIQELMTELPEFTRAHPGVEKHVFTALIRIGLNLVGHDVQVARIPPETVPTVPSWQFL